MAIQETPSAGLPVPQVPINFVPAKAGEVLKLGQMTIRIVEDDSHTDKTFSKNFTSIALVEICRTIDVIGWRHESSPCKHVI